ncbi:U1 small nuclear ribonucleoprotein 70 kda-like [Plakobranchus ocellatus]|uniref:U1 small nuclear ribonucleoprotein 70 kDa-like n=1 Tax=Plakobranchus ocellatus TaxID=259542 RepID=A0AAV3YV54_9GAST|nr:U1 small nuclear ribonucleoprotein 70 kda-like [Plakobranchus ocellatus]
MVADQAKTVSSQYRQYTPKFLLSNYAVDAGPSAPAFGWSGRLSTSSRGRATLCSMAAFNQKELSEDVN